MSATPTPTGLDLEADARMVLKVLENLHPSPLAMASIRLARHVLAHPAPAVGMEDTVHLAQLQRIEAAARHVVSRFKEIEYNGDRSPSVGDGSLYERLEDLDDALSSLPIQPKKG